LHSFPSSTKKMNHGHTMGASEMSGGDGDAFCLGMGVVMQRGFTLSFKAGESLDELVRGGTETP
jgi:hypothetical protein